jgi:lysophospholipase L1-like esterase
LNPEDAMPPEPIRHARRSFLQTLPGLAACLALPPAHALLATAEAWCATWGTAPAGPPPSASTQTFSNQTLRLIVHTSIPGSRVRVRLSNEMGSSPLRIGAAHIGLRASGASIVAGSGRDLTFAGSPGATVAPGDPLVSDPVDLAVPALADLAISLYLPASTPATTIHDLALQTNYVSTSGNFASANALPVQRTIVSWPFLTEVDVMSASGTPSAIVALGDSLTDGARSTSNANRRWTDYFARRLVTEAVPGSQPVAIVNRGISANSLLTDYPTALLAGRDSLERFDRDVLATAGTRWLFVLIGIDDIVYSPASSPIAAETLEAGWLQLIARARMRGMATIGATLTPFEGQAYYTTSREAVRQRANAWIRSAGAWDAVADFDAILRDPGRPTRLLPAYDGGDHLHPNDAGYEAMARAIPLGWFGA